MNDRTSLGALIAIDSAAALVIHDAWTGYSPHAPTLASYQLRRTAVGGFYGAGALSTALGASRHMDVKLSKGMVSKFLRALAAAPLEFGVVAYSPRELRTDDYPHVELSLYIAAEELGREGGIISMHSTGQDAFLVPWTIFVGGRVFTSTTEDIGRALKLLGRPLRRKELDRLIE